MVNTEREAVWQERVEHWRASGLSRKRPAVPPVQRVQD